MKNKLRLLVLAAACWSCQSSEDEFRKPGSKSAKTEATATAEPAFNHVAEQFADLRVLRYQVTEFDKLDLQKKTLLYYLYEAALAGRDIIYDQNYKYNLAIRKTLEAIINNYGGAESDAEYDKFLVYTKRFWFSNGIHHHYAQNKFVPECSKGYFNSLLTRVPENELPLRLGDTREAFQAFIIDQIFNPEIAPKKVSLDLKSDLVKSSAVNFYEGVTAAEVTKFYESKADRKAKRKPMYGLNSKVVKENGVVVEKVWKIDGMYHNAIERIVSWLEKASTVAENKNQKAALDSLVKYYKTGDLRDFDNYNLAWIRDTGSVVDVVNGFIEQYNDPLGRKGTFEAVVSIKDMEASRRIATIGANAQWFEDNSPILPQHKKKEVTGISAKVINVVVETGDAAPSSAIGINLPNSDWIRKIGSKSVNLGNIVEAYDQASGSGVTNEFYYNDEIRKRVKDYASLADKLHTDMHEVIGHASGQLEDGVASPDETLKNYASALEEGRADLVALYYLMDPKLVELGVMPSLDYGKSAYDEYITRGLIIQLARIEEGKDIEEAHMRNRHFIAAWCLEKGAADKVIEKRFENGKTYYLVNDYQKLRSLFGNLLRELQRIKSQGDYKAGRDLVENYGVKIDPALHREVLDRYKKLNIPPYAGFIQPKLVPVIEDDVLKDVKIEYPSDFKTQMMEYGKLYGFLPVYN